jgi:hypothetical protein
MAIELSGTSASTTTIDLARGTGGSDGAGRMSPLGEFAFHNDRLSFTPTDLDTFTWTQTATLTATDGDAIFATAVGTGTMIGGSTSRSTLISTVTGGTGRFADADGTITTSITSETVAVGESTLTTEDTQVHVGRISLTPTRRTSW